MLILYTASKCPKCPGARKVVRETAKELNWTEGKDFVEKLVDGAEMKPGQAVMEGEKYNLVASAQDITPQNIPAALVGDDFALEALMYQIASTPSIVVEEEAVFVSHVPTKEELLAAIKERI